MYARPSQTDQPNRTNAERSSSDLRGIQHSLPIHQDWWQLANALIQVKRSPTVHSTRSRPVSRILVGDAVYCASPAAGMGGSLAIIGATALVDAFTEHPEDLEAAFQEYDYTLRLFVDDIQAQAVNFGLEVFVPVSGEAIEKRNARLGLA